MPRYNKRTDFNQAEIIQEFRARDVQTIVTNWGQDFPDIMLGLRNGLKWVLVEIKQPTGTFSRGQLRFLSEARGDVTVVTNKAVVGFVIFYSNACLNSDEKDSIAKWLIKNPSQQSLAVSKFWKVIDRQYHGDEKMF